MHNYQKRFGKTVDSIITEVIIGPSYNPLRNNRFPSDCNTFHALWDTGATDSLISLNIVQELGLIPAGASIIKGIHDSRSVNDFFIAIKLKNGFIFPMLKTSQVDFKSTKFDCIIGMDIIRHGEFIISHTNGNTVFTFNGYEVDKSSPYHIEEY